MLAFEVVQCGAAVANKTAKSAYVGTRAESLRANLECDVTGFDHNYVIIL